MQVQKFSSNTRHLLPVLPFVFPVGEVWVKYPAVQFLTVPSDSLNPITKSRGIQP